MILQALIRTARTWFGVASRRGDPQRKIFPTEIELPPKPVYEAVTRAYNFLGALAGLLLLSPLLLLIALAVKLTSRGPALYRGARVGRGEAPFDIFKFRTMKTGSEARIGARLVRQDEDHYTSIGKFLRRYRLDELAQLLNVLRGDMNLVGLAAVRDALITGDMVHSPIQARFPELGMASDYDSAQAGRTRREIFGRFCDSSTLFCTSHFPSPSTGLVRAWEDGFRIEPGKDE